jgi:hypothetical protein
MRVKLLIKAVSQPRFDEAFASQILTAEDMDHEMSLLEGDETTYNHLNRLSMRSTLLEDLHEFAHQQVLGTSLSNFTLAFANTAEKQGCGNISTVLAIDLLDDGLNELMEEDTSNKLFETFVANFKLAYLHQLDDTHTQDVTDYKAEEAEEGEHSFDEDATDDDGTNNDATSGASGSGGATESAYDDATDVDASDEDEKDEGASNDNTVSGALTLVGFNVATFTAPYQSVLIGLIEETVHPEGSSYASNASSYSGTDDGDALSSSEWWRPSLSVVNTLNAEAKITYTLSRLSAGHAASVVSAMNAFLPEIHVKLTEMLLAAELSVPKDLDVIDYTRKAKILFSKSGGGAGGGSITIPSGDGGTTTVSDGGNTVRTTNAGGSTSTTHVNGDGTMGTDTSGAVASTSAADGSTTVQEPDGSSIVVSSDGDEVTSTDVSGVITHTTTNTDGSVSTVVTDTDGGESRYEVDSDGDLVSAEPAGTVNDDGSITTLHADGTSTTVSDGGSVTFASTADGSSTTHVNSDGSTTTLTETENKVSRFQV